MNPPAHLKSADPFRHTTVTRASSSGVALRALAALYALTVRQHLHGKRWLVLGALFLLPGLLAGLIRATTDELRPGMLEFLFVFMLIPQALLPLVALLYGSGIIQDEQEDQTLTYLLIRPISKWAALCRQDDRHADDHRRTHRGLHGADLRGHLHRRRYRRRERFASLPEGDRHSCSQRGGLQLPLRRHEPVDETDVDPRLPLCGVL